MCEDGSPIWNPKGDGGVHTCGQGLCISLNGPRNFVDLTCPQLAGAIAGVVVIILLICLSYSWCWRSGRTSPESVDMRQFVTIDDDAVARMERLLKDRKDATGKSIEYICNSNHKELNVNLKKVLGKGAFGTVISGTWRHHEVAVKQLFITSKSMEEFNKTKDVLLAETEITLKVTHKNVIQLHGFTTAPSLYMVLELAARGSVYSLMHEEDGALRYAWSWSQRAQGPRDTNIYKALLDVAEGMNYLHCLDPPIIHRDLKAMNILVTEDWVYKISDLGISRVKETEEESGETAMMTQCGTCVVAARIVHACQVTHTRARCLSLSSYEVPPAPTP